MAFQSFHALSSASRFVAISKISASSLTSLPISRESASNSAKKPSMSCAADVCELRYADTAVLNSWSLTWLCPSILAARSVTALWRSSRACSCGVWATVPAAGAAAGAAGVSMLCWLIPFVVSPVAPAPAPGREAVTVRGSAPLGGGLAANASPGVGAVSWPPKARPVIEWAFWTSLCRWYASSALLNGCADDAGTGSALGSRPRPRPRPPSRL